MFQAGAFNLNRIIHSGSGDQSFESIERLYFVTSFVMVKKNRIDSNSIFYREERLRSGEKSEYEKGSKFL